MWFESVRRFRARFRKRPPQVTLPAELQYRSPSQFGAVAMSEIWSASGPAIAYAETSEPRMIFRPPPLGVDDPDGIGLPVSTQIIAMMSPPPFAVAASDVRLIGARTYVMADDTFFNDEIYLGHDQDNYLTQISSEADVLNEETFLKPGASPDRLLVDRQRRPMKMLPGPVISLATPEWTGYGSFLFRLMPKLVTIADRPADWTVLAPPLLPQMRELLAMAGIAEDRIVTQRKGHVYEMARAVISSMRGTHAMIDPATCAFFAGLRDRFAGPETGRRLFISRRGWAPYGVNVRPLINEAEVEEALTAIGFEVVQPHTMTMAQQIATFASASIVVGPAGSALYNTVFCRPGTIVVDIESEPHWLLMHTNLFGTLDLPYVVFQGKAEDQDWSHPHKPLTVNVPALVARLKSL